MATQRDVQQLIQGLTPSAVNNGNPNTVYNTAPFTVSPAASIPALNLPAINTTLNAWTAPTNASPIMGPFLPQMPFGAPTGPGGGTPPVVVQPPVEPPVGPPVGNPDGGGGTRPGFPEDILGLDPDRRPRTVQTGPFGWGQDVRQPGFPNSFGGSPGSGGNGNFSWQQLLDMITEPLLPGDLFHSGTGEWDASNAGMAALDALLGPGSSWLAQQGGALTNADWYHNHLMDIAENQMRLNEGEVNANTRQRVQDDIQRTLDEMFGGANTATGRSGRSSQAAGATTIAEGKAAQDMVADMQLQSFLNKTKQQSLAAMNPRFRYIR